MGKGQGTQLKRTIMYLALCKNPEVISRIIASSPENVIKSICNAALNTAYGNVTLKKSEKKILSKNREAIERLIQKGEPPAKKRRIFTQIGGHVLASIIPTILGAAISNLGIRFISK